MPSYLALILVGLLAFVNAIRHPFVHDDVIFILNNPHIAELNHWIDAFRFSAASYGLNTYYRPVLEIIYRLEYHFWGPHPFGFHFINVLVHIINGLLLFGLLQKLGLSKSVAWVIACIFLIHPVQTEAVACIAGISNLLMALGILIALHAYLNKWYLASVLCFFVAFLSKEQAILFVPLVIVIDWSRGSKNIRPWLLMGITTGVLLLLRHTVTGASLFKDIMVSPGELYLRLAAIPRDIGMYLRLIFWPDDLHYYRNTDILQSNTIAWLVMVVAIAVILYVFLRYPQARRTMILGIGWFVAALLPVLNVVPLINEYSFILTPEHFLYLPMIGILILVVVTLDHCLKRGRGLLAGMLIGGCLLLTWHQNTFWSSEISLFERMMQFEPNFGRGHLLLAKSYWAAGQPQEADKHFKRAHEIMVGYAHKATNPIAEQFYLKYVKEIITDWKLNDTAGYHQVAVP